MDILKNKKGSTILLITVMVLTATFAITLTSAEIIRQGIFKNRTQVYSTIAYFAAEAGAERILYDVRSYYNIESCANDTCVTFGSPNTCVGSCSDLDKIQLLGNGAAYKINYTKDLSLNNVITSFGSYKDVTRAVELKY
jgi:hypothetical protein